MHCETGGLQKPIKTANCIDMHQAEIAPVSILKPKLLIIRRAPYGGLDGKSKRPNLALVVSTGPLVV
jgi:hypothetical protein